MERIRIVWVGVAENGRETRRIAWERNVSSDMTFASRVFEALVSWMTQLMDGYTQERMEKTGEGLQ